MKNMKITVAAAVLTVFTITGCSSADEADTTAAAETDEAPAAASAEPMGLLNPNLAGRDEMSGLPGMSEAALDAVMEGRPFLSMASLHEALGAHVAAEAFETLYSRLWVPIDLNSATADEILLIPGVGERMLHEFEEYRPYETMAQFDREMAKYVDDDEVARMARYVFVQIDLNTATAEEILAVPGVGERMKHEFEEYRPYETMAEFEREMAKYVDDGEVARLARYVTIR